MRECLNPGDHGTELYVCRWCSKNLSKMFLHELMDKTGCDGVTEPVLPLISIEKH